MRRKTLDQHFRRKSVDPKTLQGRIPRKNRSTKNATRQQFERIRKLKTQKTANV